MIILQPRNISGILRMQKQRHAELLRDRKHRIETGDVEVDAVHMGA